MAPSAVDIEVESNSPARASPLKQSVRTIPEIKKSISGITQSPSFPAPLQYTGSLDEYESFDVTSVIGREFPKLQISDILSDEKKIKDLAILGSRSSPSQGELGLTVENSQSTRSRLFQKPEP